MRCEDFLKFDTIHTSRNRKVIEKMTTNSLSLRDQQMMVRALQLGAKARYLAPPNPWVGCVLTKNQHIIGEGHTQAFGHAHAETQALEAAGLDARGATAYATLEPCSHHGHTPPCCVALAQAGVERVVIALEDPDPRVQGKGIHYLRSQGITVDVGIEKELAEKQLAPYLHHRRTGSAYCLLKMAASADGRTAAADGSSQWISCIEARKDVHELRDLSQAIVVGAQTAIQDQPKLNIRHHEARSPRPPLRVLLDAKGQVPATGPLFDMSISPTLVFTSDSCPPDARKAWESSGAEVEILPTTPKKRFHLPSVLKNLGERQVLQACFEAGATLAHSLVQENLVNHLVLYIGPRLLGEQGYPLLKGPSPESLTKAPRLQLNTCSQLGHSVRLDYTFNPAEES